ncbi:MAG: competence/damage-inducible protein A [Actinomycetota bacterium]|nr:competence/damage-inducible protein A [Actinomycetota bacterium]
MIVEVVAVGTELLLGQIVNSNASTIGAALAEMGFDAHFQQVVGDNLDRVAESIQTALDRSDAVIITGGIGPTQDDLTREAVCAATGLEMEYSEEYADHLLNWWEARGREMPKSNLQQAEHPAGAELLDNPKGTAPGLVIDHEGTLIFCVPGVPAEMEYLLHEEVLPRIAEASEEVAVIESKLLRTWGRSESDVAETLDDLYSGSTNPSLAFLASSGEIKVRITAKAGDAAAARALIEPMEMEVRSRLGASIFGTGDETIERVLLRLLADLDYTIATTESMTGGRITAALTSLPGASQVVRGGLVAYASELKASLLGVSDITTVVNAETVEEMASNGRAVLGADVVVAVTGSAGPEPLEKPPGTFVVGVATPDRTQSREFNMVGDRERVRTYAVTAALQLTRLALIGEWWSP